MHYYTWVLLEEALLSSACLAPGKSPRDLHSSEWHGKLTDPKLLSLEVFPSESLAA